MDDLKKLKKKKGKIFPGESFTDDEGLVNAAYELDAIDQSEKPNNKKILNKLRAAAKLTAVSDQNPLNVITSLRQGASHWKNYVNSKRKTHLQEKGANIEGEPGSDRRRTGGDGLDYEIGDKTFETGSISAFRNQTHRQMVVAQNRNLIEYFAKLGQSNNQNECIDFDYVDQLLNNGARINCTDKYGQTALHEAARAWHVDVARYLLKKGADINQADNYGRTALHIAAAVDYPEMISYLIRKGANKEAKTTKEEQTPVHFAARNDACLALKTLIKERCRYKRIEDYKGRTPLHIAAELDRSEAARFLLELDNPAPAGVMDKSGQTAMVWMITKMPSVAKLALDQLREMDRANRKQFFHLYQLEPRKAGKSEQKVKPEEGEEVEEETYPQTPLQVIVHYRQFDLILHPVFLKLIKIKWQKFGKLGAWLSIIQNLVFILLWTVYGILVEYDKRYYYDLPSQWWRIVLFLLAVASTVWQLKDELTEFFNSKKAHRSWITWRENEIKKDLGFAHPRWPEEEQYLKQEIEALDDTGPQYFKEYWNIFDWLCYTLLLLVIITHLVDVFQHSDLTARLHIRILAVTIILIWLRLMKNARAFSYTGPFIVMLSHMVADCFRFAFLYGEFYLPYACAFWMLFGGDKVPAAFQGSPDGTNNTIIVEGMKTPNDLFFSLFRMTLVDDYDYANMKLVDSVMADILIGTWLALSAIIMLNLFIALMSDTFQRVYDNAQANAVMQKAIQILSIEEGMNRKRKEKFHQFLEETCNPLTEFYDDDETSDSSGKDLQKITIQIKEQLDEWEENFGHIFTRSSQPKGGMLIQNSPSKSVKSDTDSRQGGRRQSSVVMDNDIGNQESNLAQLQLEVSHIKREMLVLQDTQQAMMNSLQQDLSLIKTMLYQGLHNQPSRPDYGPGVGRQMSVYSGTPAFGGSIYSIANNHFGSLQQPRDEEWERLEQKRQKDLLKLKEQLSKQQQIVASQNIYRSSDSTPIIVEVSTTPAEPDLNSDSSQQDSQGSGHSSDTMVRHSKKNLSKKTRADDSTA